VPQCPLVCFGSISRFGPCGLAFVGGLLDVLRLERIDLRLRCTCARGGITGGKCEIPALLSCCVLHNRVSYYDACLGFLIAQYFHPELCELHSPGRATPHSDTRPSLLQASMSSCCPRSRARLTRVLILHPLSVLVEKLQVPGRKMP